MIGADKLRQIVDRQRHDTSDTTSPQQHHQQQNTKHHFISFQEHVCAKLSNPLPLGLINKKSANPSSRRGDGWWAVSTRYENFPMPPALYPKEKKKMSRKLLIAPASMVSLSSRTRRTPSFTSSLPPNPQKPPRHPLYGGESSVMALSRDPDRDDALSEVDVLRLRPAG